MIKDIKYIHVWERTLDRTTGTAGEYDYNGRWVYNLTGVIDVFGSAIFNSSFGGRGDFELTIPYNNLNLRMLHLNSDEEREKFIASPDAVQGHEYLSLSLYLTIDGVNDIFCVEKITYERNDNGAIYIVISGSNGLGLFDGLYLGQTRTYSKNIDGTTTVVQGITGRKCVIKNVNDGSATTYGVAYAVLCALVGTGWQNVELGGETVTDYNALSYQRGYKLQFDYNSTGGLNCDLSKQILNDSGNKYNPTFTPAQLSALIADFCSKYVLGFEYTFEKQNDGFYMPVVTVKDCFGDSDVYLKDEMPIIKNTTLSIDLTNMSEQYIALGTKDSESNFYTYGISTGQYYLKTPVTAYRNKAVETNITTEHNSYSKEYRNDLYSLAVKNRKANAVETVTGTISVVQNGNAVLEGEIYLGNKRKLEIFNRVVDIYISNLTYVKDNGGFTINCDYRLSY